MRTKYKGDSLTGRVANQAAASVELDSLRTRARTEDMPLSEFRLEFARMLDRHGGPRAEARSNIEMKFGRRTLAGEVDSVRQHEAVEAAEQFLRQAKKERRGFGDLIPEWKGLLASYRGVDVAQDKVEDGLETNGDLGGHRVRITWKVRDGDDDYELRASVPAASTMETQAKRDELQQQAETEGWTAEQCREAFQRLAVKGSGGVVEYAFDSSDYPQVRFRYLGEEVCARFPQEAVESTKKSRYALRDRAEKEGLSLDECKKEWAREAATLRYSYYMNVDDALRGLPDDCVAAVRPGAALPGHVAWLSASPPPPADACEHGPGSTRVWMEMGGRSRCPPHKTGVPVLGWSCFWCPLSFGTIEEYVLHLNYAHWLRKLHRALCAAAEVDA